MMNSAILEKNNKMHIDTLIKADLSVVYDITLDKSLGIHISYLFIHTINEYLAKSKEKSKILRTRRKINSWLLV